MAETYNYLQAASYGVQAFGQIANASQQARAMRLQGQEQERIFKLNARIADIQASDAVRRGEEAAKQYQTRINQIVGAQRASAGAQGIEVDSGSMADIQTDTISIGQQDIQTIRNNAWREAWGFRVESVSASAQSRYADLSSQQNSKNTLLTGYTNAFTRGLQGVGAYYDKR